MTSWPGGDPHAPGSDVEEEEEDTSVAITTPFDPSKIRVKFWTPTVDLVLKRIKANEIDLAPDFQRAADIWKERAQCRLVESLLIRIPLPAFYVDGSDEDKLLVIDGVQRLTALSRFVDGEFALRELEYLGEAEGKRFADLPRPFMRRIEETMLTVHILEKGTPDEAKLNIFKRLNTGGLPLTSQEIRHAMTPGPVREFLKRLTLSRSFKDATQGAFDDRRMTDRECALRFCAFRTAPSHYSSGDLDRFLLEAMRQINATTEADRAYLTGRFERAMNAARDVLGNQAFRKPSPSRRLPVNKALFEAWAVGFDARTDTEIARLIERAAEVQRRFGKLFEEKSDFQTAISQGTGDPSKVKLRFAAIDDLLSAVGAP